VLPITGKLGKIFAGFSTSSVPGLAQSEQTVDERRGARAAQNEKSSHEHEDEDYRHEPHLRFSTILNQELQEVGHESGILLKLRQTIHSSLFRRDYTL
jgi:hypothetical protein